MYEMKNTLNGVNSKSEERRIDFLSKCNNFKVLKKELVNCESIHNKNIKNVGKIKNLLIYKS